MTSSRPIRFCVIVFILCGVTFSLYFGFQHKIAKVPTVEKAEPIYLYVDVGGNRGDTLRSFYEKKPTHHTNNPFVVLPKILYKLEPSEWKVFAFEADSIHTAELQELEKQHSNLKIYTETAAWINSDGITIYPDRQGRGTGFWGTSISDTKKNVNKTKPMHVRSIDFSGWLTEHVQPDDFLVLKMNIEGAEFEILDKLLKDNTFCLIDALFICYHAKVAFQGKNELANEMPNRVRKRSAQRDCRVEILYESER
ncbi:uncharacterized protein LOC144445913 [Glandiceps talaboti]